MLTIKVSQNRIICYYQNWIQNAKNFAKTPDDQLIDATTCTHLNFILPKITSEFTSGSRCNEDAIYGMKRIKNKTIGMT